MVLSPGHRLLGALLFVSLAVGCASGAKVRADVDVIKADVERARKLGAMRCAPQDLATAEASLEFARSELAQGESGRAEKHTRDAEDAVKRALVLSRDCAPKQAAPQVVKIEEQDKDGDTIPDKDDKCPEEAEDKDGFEDLDGCPDIDNDGDSVLDVSDKCALLAGPVGNQGCPVEPKDTDLDMVMDEVDRCLEQPEDRDGFQDEDGCPDPDNDGDGLVDASDKCPDVHGVLEEQGCPKKYKMVVVTKEKIEIKQQLKFTTGSAKIANRLSHLVLDDVGAALRDNKQIKKIRIDGHTDSVGNDETNLKLSQKRADAVLSQLMRRGIEPTRLEAVGYGETQPIASNSTASGRAENRRTEFNIVEQ